MESTPLTASEYYNKQRKQSFLLSRIAVVVSMLILVIALGINIAARTAQKKAATISHAATIPITVMLPKLPPECNFDSSTRGSAIHCTQTHVPIPTVPVTLPQACITSAQLNKVTCRNEANKETTVPLPLLPNGCFYKLVTNKYFIVCEGKIKS